MTYRCPKCRCYVDAIKGMFDHRCPHYGEVLAMVPAPDDAEPASSDDTELETEVF